MQSLHSKGKTIKPNRRTSGFTDRWQHKRTIKPYYMILCYKFFSVAQSNICGIFCWRMAKHQQEVRAMEVNLQGVALLHLLITRHGNVFSMSEVAVELFHENPGAFGKELKAGRYSRIQSVDKGVLQILESLRIPPESETTVGATLLPPETLEAILLDRRKEELVPAVKAALLRIVSQEVAYLLGNQLHEEALPLAMDAVQQGQALFYPSSTPQLVPLYLMAIQANLGLGRATQSEDLLGLAVWLLLQDTKSAHNGMRAELGRLFGQLYMLQGNFQTALKAFSEEVYYSAIERGIFDTHTSLGFFHLCEVFKKLGKVEDSLACGDIVIQTWLSVLQASVFTQPVSQMNSFELSDHTTLNVPMRSRLFENLHPKEIVHMLQVQNRGSYPWHNYVNCRQDQAQDQKIVGRSECSPESEALKTTSFSEK
ncbi:hypothetical protein O6H91_07G095700 [Diphasiastrum complanatum]|uniref:Uncharacterized protein n=1 Tax=Diphasiastrum complanatum TaxID=34168 RepID=A0ACC2D8R5_DIPCM|nr:hypothetical protein O6H91_07G095700 [Diphasiastrum complanatum]